MKKKSIDELIKRNRWRIIVIGICIIIFFGLYLYANKILPEQRSVPDKRSEYAKGTVRSVLIDNSEKDETAEGIYRGSQELEIEITSGDKAGSVFNVTNYIGDLFQTHAVEGTKFILQAFDRKDGGTEYEIISYDRTVYIVFAVACFILLLIITGGTKGLRAVLALVFTLISVFFILIQMIYFGIGVLLPTILIVFLTTVFSFAVIDGVNVKTVCAMTGTLLGVLAAGIFAFISGEAAHVSGLSSTEAEELMLTGRDYGMQIKNLFTAGILISALGAVMDVAMSIASSIHELHEVNKKLSAKELFRSGMNIGRDAMGTMANTLILAFVGASLTLIILLYSYDIPFIRLINTDFLVMEIIQGIAGSIGIVLTVPLVAAITAFAHAERKKN